MTILQKQGGGFAIAGPAGHSARRPYVTPRTDARTIWPEERCWATSSEVVEDEKTFDSAISNTNSTFEAFDANNFGSGTAWD